MSKTVNVIVERNSFVVTVDKEMISLVRILHKDLILLLICTTKEREEE